MSQSYDLSKVDALFASGYFGARALETPELYWVSLMSALLPYRDHEGRPLGEEMSPAESRAGVPMEMRECPYSGSRRKHALPMNISSLKQFNEYWLQVIGGVAVLRDDYLRYTGRPLTGPVNMVDMWKFSRLGVTLPAYLLRRAQAPLADGQIPAMTAIMFRMMLGVNRVSHLQVLIIISAGLFDQMEVLDPAVLYEFTDANDLFIGLTSVCAGPKGMVEETFRVMIDGQPPRNADRGPMQALADRSFHEYANLLMGLDAQKYIFGARATSLLHELARRLSNPKDGEPRPGELAAALEKFELETAEKVSSLAQEVAAADEDVRERIIQNLERFRDELDAEQKAISGEGLSEFIQRHERAPRSSSAVPRVMELLRKGRPVEVGLRPFAEALVDYLHLERANLAIFEQLQARVEKSLGHPAVAPTLGGTDILKMAGPKLRDFTEQFFGVRIQSGSAGTTLRVGTEELAL
jgi:hypothetical protein